MAVADSLRKMVIRSSNPLGRLHALWTLDGLDSLDDATLHAALGDPRPGIRRHSIRLAEDRIEPSAEFTEAVVGLANDPDPTVRFQATLTLGSVDSPQAATSIVALLGNANEKWIRMAALCSSSAAPWRLLSQLIKRRDWTETLSADQSAFLEELGEQFASGSNSSERDHCVTWLSTSSDDSASPARIAVLAGLTKGLSGAPASQGGLSAVLDSATRVAADAKPPFHLRLQAIEVLARCRAAGAESVLLELLRSTYPPGVQAAAARSLAQWGDTESCKRVYERWSEQGIAARQATLESATQTPAATAALLDAIELETVLPTELPAAARAALLEIQSDALRPRIERLLTSANQVDRASVVASYETATKMAGEAQRGAKHFAEHCIVCHAIQARGGRVGPDLAGVGSRRNDLLIVDILDPSRTVSADYVNYFVSTERGQTLTGLIAAETADAITLTTATGDHETIARSSIVELRSTGKSIMPDGVEEKLSPQQLADVLEFLRRPDRQLLPAKAGVDEQKGPP
jgi:putative heme-binding domain-containing protein